MASGSKTANKSKRDFTVCVQMKKGPPRFFPCGPSLRGAQQCAKAIEDFGKGQIEKTIIAASRHVVTESANDFMSLEAAQAELG